MPLMYNGNNTWQTTMTAGTTIVVNTVPFRPKGMMVLTVQVTAGADDGRGIGYASGPTERRCIGGKMIQGAAAMDTQQFARNDAIMAQISNTPAIIGLLDLQSFDENGFTLVVDQQLTGSDVRILWTVWGGDDLENVAVGDFAEPAATGNQDYTVTGSFQPEAVLFAGCQLTAAFNALTAVDMGLMFGGATGSGAGNQFVVLLNEDEGSSTSDADQYQRGDECIAMIAAAGGNPSSRATFSQFNSDGFRLNWLARATTGRKYIYIAFRGGHYKAGSGAFVASGTSVISSLTFRPTGVVASSTFDGESVAGTSVATDSVGSQGDWSVGAWAVNQNLQHTIGIQDFNGQGNAAFDIGSTTSASMLRVGDGTMQYGGSLPTSTGFTLSGNSATFTYFFMAFGHNPGYQPLRKTATGSVQRLRR